MNTLPHCRPSPRLAVAPLLILLLAGACASRPAPIEERDPYPAAIKHGPTLDIQVFRRDTEIEFTNTTAQVFGPCTLWLNGRFSHHLDKGLAVGQNVRLPLTLFRDQFGDPFRAGGFFATEQAERLALAEIQTDDQILGLVVVGGSDE